MSLYVDIEKDLGSFKLKVKFEQENGILGLLGQSGCGKSMTLKCIAGIVKPDKGKIISNGTVFFDSEKKNKLISAKEKSRILVSKLCPVSTYVCKRKYTIGNSKFI